MEFVALDQKTVPAIARRFGMTVIEEFLFLDYPLDGLTPLFSEYRVVELYTLEQKLLRYRKKDDNTDYSDRIRNEQLKHE